MKSKYVLTLAIAAALPAIALIAQVPPHGPMKGMVSKMMETHQNMEAEMKAQDVELDRLCAEMNSAPADKKLDAVAAVVAKLVEQRKTMHSRISGMPGSMMSTMECCRRGMEMMGQPGGSPTPAGR